jgi:hypothetical protein
MTPLDVRQPALFKKRVALFLLAGLLAPFSFEGEATATPHRLEVDVRPARFSLRRGRLFDGSQLLTALQSRLSKWRLTVVRRGQKHATSKPTSEGKVWRLLVRARLERKRARALTIEFRDPDGRPVMLRRIARLRRYRAYDLAQTISLSTVESLIGVLDPVKFPDLVAPSEPVWPAPKKPATRRPPASRPAPPKKPRPETMRFSMGLQAAGALLTPGGDPCARFGLHLRLRDRRWLAHLSLDGWAPIGASGERYQVDVWIATAYLGAGLRQKLGRWALGMTIGPALRVAAEDRRGADVHPAKKLRVSGGFASRLFANLQLGSRLTLETFVGLVQLFPHHIYELSGERVLEVGGFMASLGLALLVTP